MCELFGICAAESIVANDLLEAFFHHSDVHKHGWGLAVFYGERVSIEKEAVKALDSVYLRQRLSRNVAAANLFAHIRFATIGRIEYANCHPFVWDDAGGRTWTMVHNGTLFQTERLMPFLDLQEGTTDSERLLLYIVSRMNDEIAKAGQPLDEQERFRILDEVITQMAYDNKLNLLLYDGEYMYVHTNCRGSLHVWQDGRRALFSTRPLLMDGWKELPRNQLLIYRSGRLQWLGTDHGQEFHEEDHDMTPLMSAFSEL